MSAIRDPTVLISPDAPELRDGLLRRGVQVIDWPSVAVRRLRDSPALDEAIENLYGYDWLIFSSDHSVHFFVERLRECRRDVNDLDSLRVCAIGNQTVTALEEIRVHVDVIATGVNCETIVHELATYVGGHDLLQRLNFLIPQAAIGRNSLKTSVEDAGARADVVATYRTVADADTTRLVALQTMLQTGSVDAVIFRQSSDVEEFARLFDTTDTSRLLKDSLVVGDEHVLQAAEGLGTSRAAKISDLSADKIVELLKEHFA